MKANRLQMKEINKNLVRQVLKQRRKATKPELAELTELSVVTVNTLIGEMAVSGEVMEGEEVPSNGGRPSRQYLYNGNFKQAVVIYGYEEKKRNLFHMLIINLFGECIYKTEAYFDTVVTDSFERWLDDAILRFQNISLISFGLPGVEENGIITLNDYPAIVGEEFLSYYQKKYQVPVLCENDVNATVTGYYASQDPLEVKNVVGLYYPRSYGPGSGIIIKGEVYKGSKNFAGELAFITVKPSWDEVDFENAEEVIKMLRQVILIYSCVLAPERFVLYGDFLTEEIREELIREVKELLNGKFTPCIEVKVNLAEDFKQGMIRTARQEIERKEEITAWY